ncbi:hypothetical protein Hanom_Chr07g00632391 [Helianthus anomalus]
MSVRAHRAAAVSGGADVLPLTLRSVPLSPSLRLPPRYATTIWWWPIVQLLTTGGV